MVIALVMLLVALGLVLVKDRDFWFAAPETADSEAIDDSAPTATEATAAARNACQYDHSTCFADSQKKRHPPLPCRRASP